MHDVENQGGAAQDHENVELPAAAADWAEARLGRGGKLGMIVFISSAAGTFVFLFAVVQFAKFMGRLALAQSNVGQYEAAERTFEKAASVSPDDNFMSWLRENEGRMYIRIEDGQRAKSALGTALQLREKVWGNTHPSLRSIYQAQASVQILLGDFPGAEQLAHRALELHDGVGLQGYARAATLTTLGNALAGQQKFGAAAEAYSEAQPIFASTEPRNPEAEAVNAGNLALLYSNWGDTLAPGDQRVKFEEAEAQVRKVEELNSSAYIEPGTYALALQVEVHILDVTKRPSEAVRQKLQSLTTGPPIGPGPPIH